MEKVNWARQTGAIVGSKTHLEEPKAGGRKEKPNKLASQKEECKFCCQLSLCIAISCISYYCVKLRMLMLDTYGFMFSVVQEQGWELVFRIGEAETDSFMPVVFVWFSFLANLEVLKVILV